MKQTNQKKVAKRLKDLRESHGMSMADLSALTGISVPSISCYEDAKRNPSDENKCLIARAYGLTVGEIFFPEN